MDSGSERELERNDDELISGLLQPLDAGVTPIPEEVLDRLTKLAGDEFARSESDVVPNDTVATSDINYRRKNLMIRVAVSLTAIAATLLFVIFSPLGRAAGNSTLGSILDKAVASGTLHLKVIKDGTEANVWVRDDGGVRWEDSASEYRIARGSQLWRIDESSNTVNRESNPWFLDQDTPVDLLALLGLDEQQSTTFRNMQATGTVEHAERKCQLFQMTANNAGQPLVIEACADLGTGELLSITAWPEGIRTAPPLAELRLVARNVPIEESKFVVGQSLSEDGRIGKIVDSQGIVMLRPMMNNRWTPVAGPMIVKPGDWLRTDVRGANAATVTTTGQFRVITGPGTLVELQGADQVKLLSGEVNITGDPAASGDLELLGPGEQKISVKAGESVHYRIAGQGPDALLVQIAQKPVWLAGFEGSSSNESLGSLICNIDGRSTPLTVGFHKVQVDIRDQIARTTIEESFVNNTSSTLEGIFHFPLPQDASISGFGMWINGELIEADVVEKQRAREIYETILREKRDPGLLEWAGGNIFKARVFPIPAHSEKRIRIVYTQVLPMRANRYRYSYGLRSEMLQKTPLRELRLEVQVNSTLPLKKVTCSTHEVRSQSTEHSAKVEFAAQQYTPTRDFDVAFEVDSRQSDVVVIPHQRGEDGYFMVQLTPPTTDGNWRREVLPDGKPLNVLLVCDTSGSMDSEKRALQENLVSSILASLGPGDRFNIAVCDVNCDWLNAESVLVTHDEIARANRWLNERISLGWTDLDRMAESALTKMDGQTHVVYIGDGIVTAHDASPQNFANRLKRMTAEKTGGTFHAVSVGNSYESTVLKAFVQVGGGSVRQIGGEQSPQRVAFELLNEIAQPGLKNLKVEFRGLKVAAVYPDTLPNLAAGMQQILIGRYLPQGADQSGEIVITGTRNGEEVRYASRISLADSESGNSFIPRLWARAHLDSLLGQGSSSFIQNEIISLSEEFHIITPYTSLLVLETDEDRERFGVKRRFQMRDGERFFTDGRDNANFELFAQQMKRAGDWRSGLRRQILIQLSQLGRDPQLFQQIEQQFGQSPFGNSMVATGGIWSDTGRSGSYGGGYGGLGGGGRMQPFPSTLGLIVTTGQSAFEYLPSDEMNLPFEQSNLAAVPPQSGGFGSAEDLDSLGENIEDLISDLSGSDFKKDKSGLLRQDQGGQQYFFEKEVSEKWEADSRSRFLPARQGRFDLMSRAGESRSSHLLSGIRVGQAGRYYDAYEATRYIHWLDTLFPQLPDVPVVTTPAESKWSDEAIAISKALQQTLSIESGGIEVNRHVESADPRRDRVTGQGHSLELFSPRQWLSLSESVASQTAVHWCDENQRGVFSRAFQLGRVRPPKEGDLESLVPGLRPYSNGDLHSAYSEYAVDIQHPAADRVLLRLITSKEKSAPRLEIQIDATRNVVLQSTWRTDDKITSSTRYSDYVQTAGVWWPGKVESFDDQGRRNSITNQTVVTLTDEEFSKRLAQEKPDPEKSQLLSMPLPTVESAEVAATDGTAGFDHRVVLLLNSCLIQAWDESLKQLAELEKAAPNKPGTAWIRAAVLIAARRNEEVRQLLNKLADTLVEKPFPNEYFLAGYIPDQSNQISDQNEMLELLDRLKPVFQRQPEIAEASRNWNTRRAQSLRSLGRVVEAMELQRDLATTAPWNFSAQLTFARDLSNAGDVDGALAWLHQEIDRERQQNDYETYQLRDLNATILREQGRADELVTFFEEWDSRNPQYQTAYMQYLNALELADRTEEADALAKKWMVSGRLPGRLETGDLMRLNAAISYALGQRYQNYSNWIDPQWFGPLAETAEYFLEHEFHFQIAATILVDGHFEDSPESDRLYQRIADRLRAGAAELKLEYLSPYVRWSVYRQEISADQWKQVVDTLRGRWEAATDRGDIQALGTSIVEILAGHFHDTDQLPFLREQIARAERDEDKALRAANVDALFTELLSREWQDDYETEAIALIPQLSSSEFSSQRLAVQVNALHRFVDAMLQAHVDADQKKLQDEGHPEELTRTELATKIAEIQKAAREGMAARLTETEAELADQPLRAWVQAERMYIDLRLDRNQAEVAEWCWTILGEAPVAEPALEITDDESIDNASLVGMQSLLRERAFAMVSYMAVRRSAAPELVERVLKYMTDGTRLEEDVADYWKQIRFSLLVALDRPEALEMELRNWIRSDKYPVPWQLSLGRLLAERGDLEEAIGLFETVERDGPLSPSDYAALADWYLVTQRRDGYRRAKVAVFMSMEEYEISNWIRQNRQRWYRTDVALPTELDENVLFAFQALFQKSNQPGDYTYELRDFYSACRDFRLLRMIPDAVAGRTPQQIYPFLKSLRSNVLVEIRKEATSDELLQRLTEVREQIRKTTNQTVDLRALDLLESMIERQASDVLNQPGPHIDAAVAALTRAFDRQWADGEIRQMADLLNDLGRISHAKLNDERLRQLRELYRMTEPGTEDRLFVGWYTASSLFWSCDDRQQGLATMEATIDEIDAVLDGWPAHLNAPLDAWISMLEAEGRYAVGESVLTKQLALPANVEQNHWLTQRRNKLYSGALAGDGQVSLGSGRELFVNLEKHLLAQAEETSDSHRYEVLIQLLQIYHNANAKKFASNEDHLRRFAFEWLPPVLNRQTNNYRDLVSQTAETLKQLLGSRDALAFMIDRFESYPKRFQNSWESPWQQFSWQLSRWRQELADNPGDLEPRLLAIVLDELRRDLSSRQNRTRYFYHRNYNEHFWEEKEQDFLRVAEEVLAEQSESGRSVAYIADYLYSGLEQHDRAIEVLFAAYRQKILDRDQQIVLCDYLQNTNRHGDSIPILEPIVKDNPDEIAYRVRLITAYVHSSQPQPMQALLAETDKHFRQAGRWTESNISQLAWCCLSNELFERAVGYYGEVIPLHQRTQPSRGIGNGTLAGYYGYLSQAWTGLGNTIEAVDAAAAGVVAWGPNRSQRDHSSYRIEEALSSARDVDDYVAHLDKQVAETGQDSPLIRQKLGVVYAGRKQYQHAITQFLIAIALQPTDVATHIELIKAYDAIDDPKGAVRQTLALLQFDRHNLEQYKKLAERWKSDESLSERASTTVVEAAPNEAEHHQALAEFRQEQDRWDEAIEQWRHVAGLRSLEPDGLLKLTEALIHEKRWDEARESIGKLNQTQWSARFSNVGSTTENLQRQLPDASR